MVSRLQSLGELSSVINAQVNFQKVLKVSRAGIIAQANMVRCRQ